MRIEEREVTIPEKVIPKFVTKKIVYIAFDGKEFDFGPDCSDYEMQLKRNRSFVYQTMVNGYEVQDLYKNQIQLFYIKSINDLKDLEKLDVIQLPYKEPPKVDANGKPYILDTTYCDFEIYGQGWYMVYFKSSGYYGPDKCYILNWINYVLQEQRRINEYQEKICKMLEDKLKELTPKRNQVNNDEQG